MKNLLILGCGWVGEELAHQLKRKGWNVWVTTTTEEKYHRLKNDGIFAYIHNFDRDLDVDLPIDVSFDAVVNSIPATQRNSEGEIEHRFSYVFRTLCSINYKQHIFLSSVGVYPDLDDTFFESYADEEQMSPKLRLAETKMMSLPATSTFRLGGLFGKNRVFGKYFQDKVVSIGDQPANFIHLDDVVGIIEKAIETKLQIGYYNLVAPEHPSKKDVILKSAQKYMYSYPTSFEPSHSFQKIVNGDKISKLLNYEFKYPSPLDF